MLKKIVFILQKWMEIWKDLWMNERVSKSQNGVGVSKPDLAVADGRKSRKRAHEKSAKVHEQVREFLFSKYDFRYNVLTDQVEFRNSNDKEGCFQQVDRRTLNTMVIETQNQGINCWDKDVERLLKSKYVGNFHPFFAYMEALPKWDGKDRVTPLALRVDDDPVWVNGFRRWLLALTAQWMGLPNQCANTLTPILISPQQGMSKSSFCRKLMPIPLLNYYLDKLDLNSKANAEMKLGLFGLINLDEFDRYSPAAMATLKNLVQLKKLTVKKAYASYFSQLGRIASFIGTSNQMELLNDPTGSRRFLCVEVKHKIDCSPVEHEQLFAQLKQMVNSGERVWMDTSEETELQQHNLLFSRLRPEEEVFHQLYFVPRPGEDCKKMTVTEIHRNLCKHNPTAMRGVSVQNLGRTLSGMGLRRVHTKVGNKYFVGVLKQAV